MYMLLLQFSIPARLILHKEKDSGESFVLSSLHNLWLNLFLLTQNVQTSAFARANLPFLSSPHQTPWQATLSMRNIFAISWKAKECFPKPNTFSKSYDTFQVSCGLFRNKGATKSSKMTATKDKRTRPSFKGRNLEHFPNFTSCVNCRCRRGMCLLVESLYRRTACWLLTLAFASRLTFLVYLVRSTSSFVVQSFPSPWTPRVESLQFLHSEK